MAEVSVIGLGAMGSALARALLTQGHRVTVWNRTSAKAEPLVGEGAVLAPSVASAVRASPVFVVCVDDYDVTNRILATDDVPAAMAGRTMVQLSSGTPQQARDTAAWARKRGADYLDGAILAWPKQIGTPDATILMSGPESAYRGSEPLLKSVAGNLVYLGEQVSSAAALECAVGSFLVAAILGFVHGALICESEGLPVDSFGTMIADVVPVIGQEAKHLGEVIQTGAYEGPEASLVTYANYVERIVQNAREGGINSDFPKFASGPFQRAVAAGHGEEEVASLIKILRRGN